LLCCSSGVFLKLTILNFQFFIFINTINKQKQFICDFSNFPSINIYNQRQLLTIEKIINTWGLFVTLAGYKFFLTELGFYQQTESRVTNWNSR
jgi:hypothetical protein